MIAESQQDSNTPNHILKSLAEALEQENPVTLNREQIRVLRLMLDRVARDQFLITALQRRLKRYSDADAEIETEANALFERIRKQAADSNPDTGFDYQRARRARLEFTRKVEQAHRIPDMAAAALGLVLRLAPLL